MFGFGPATRIYVAAGVTDMRKNFNGLHGLVRDQLGCDPQSGHVFLFANARRNRLKLLVYDGSAEIRRHDTYCSRSSSLALTLADGWSGGAACDVPGEQTLQPKDKAR